MTENHILSIKKVSKQFADQGGPDFAALKDINLEVRSGEFFVCVGPSGSGKSTLLRMMSGLEKSFEGSIQWAPGLLPTDFSFVFQQFAIFPWLTVRENVELPLVSRKVPERQRHEKVRAELRQMHLEDAAHLYPKELSGGMRQRVGIARALVTDPKVIFMDEPFSELDSFIAEELRQEMLSIWESRHPTIIMVTHIIEEALELADRIAVLTPRPGRIEHIFTNRLPRPRAKRSEDFFRLEDEVYKAIKP